jgi:hypothetical protein
MITEMSLYPSNYVFCYSRNDVAVSVRPSSFNRDLIPLYFVGNYIGVLNFQGAVGGRSYGSWVRRGRVLPSLELSSTTWKLSTSIIGSL